MSEAKVTRFAWSLVLRNAFSQGSGLIGCCMCGNSERMCCAVSMCCGCDNTETGW